MNLTFCGAARIVTGSCYLIETGKDKILVDCGMFQGTKDITRLNYEPFKFDPKKISCVLLTHAHIDHCGLIPKLVKEGFKGKIYATSATIDLCRIMLEDSAVVQQTQTEEENKIRVRQGLEPRYPLYDVEEALASFKHFSAVEYDRTYSMGKNVQARYVDAGHIIGSSSIEINVTENSETKKIVFSGDLGQWDAPIVHDPTIVEDTDYLVIESTYGNRLHDDIGEREEQLLSYVRETYKKRGKLIIPSFAVERTQELLFSFNKLFRSGDMPNEKVFLDSPLAIKATEIFTRHREGFDKEALKYKDPFNFKNLVYTNSTEESKQINEYRGPCVIIAGNGMATGGRVRHHFKHGLWDPKNTVLFVGYQAQGTLGREIVDGAKMVRMMGMTLAVKADIRTMNSYSAHADMDGLLRWVYGMKRKPKKIFLVHGEPDSIDGFRVKLKKEGYKIEVPKIGETVVI
ncbi:MAG: MBL fold metallo-hydrolase [Candidatus Altiarchaeia archaeon]